MKRFQFSLEPVRQWRLQQADMEALRLLQVQAELVGLERQRDALFAELDDARDILNQKTLDASQLSDLDNFRRYVQEQLPVMKAREQECQTRIDGQLQRVVHARRAEELLARLKKKSLAEWQAESGKELEETAADLFLAKRQRESE